MLEDNKVKNELFDTKVDEYISALKEVCDFNGDAQYGSVSMALFQIKKYPYVENIVKEILQEACVESEYHTPYSISQKFIALYPTKVESLSSDSIAEVEVPEDEIWYQFSSFCTHMLPQTKTDRTEVITKYPNHTMSIECVKGVPYGGIARMIILYVNSMAVKYRSKEIEIGSSIKSFVENLGYSVNYRKGSINDEVMQQLEKIYHSTFVLSKVVKTMSSNNEVLIEENKLRFHLFDGQVTWNIIQNSLSGNNGAKVIISNEYFKEILAHPVPLSFEALKSLKKSPFALDLYAFISYRANSNRMIAAKLNSLQCQFGDDGPTWRFKEKLQRALIYLHKEWPQCNVILKKDVLLIPKMAPHIAEYRALH
jgi:hypothetical protein